MGYKITQEQEKILDELEQRVSSIEIKNTPISLGDMFNHAPEGDFEWKQEEAGDWHVYHCGEKDCPVGWHTIAYATDMGRKDGKCWVELRSVDSDGNWDFDTGYDEREGDTSDSWHWIGQTLADQSDEFFKGWALYWIDAARTGKDPCNPTPGDIPDEEWFDFCLNGAEDNLKYIEKKGD
jgi:hypothetical protein